MKLPGASFDLRIWRKEESVALTITGLGGERVMVPITTDVAEELGMQLLAGVLALTGRLDALNQDGLYDRAKVA